MAKLIYLASISNNQILALRFQEVHLIKNDFRRIHHNLGEKFVFQSVQFFHDFFVYLAIFNCVNNANLNHKQTMNISFEAERIRLELHFIQSTLKRRGRKTVQEQSVSTNLLIWIFLKQIAFNLNFNNCFSLVRQCRFRNYLEAPESMRVPSLWGSTMNIYSVPLKVEHIIERKSDSKIFFHTTEKNPISPSW